MAKSSQRSLVTRAGDAHTDVVNRRTFLADLGYRHPVTIARAEEVLAVANLINLKRDGMATWKCDAVRGKNAERTFWDRR